MAVLAGETVAPAPLAQDEVDAVNLLLAQNSIGEIFADVVEKQALVKDYHDNQVAGWGIEQQTQLGDACGTILLLRPYLSNDPRNARGVPMAQAAQKQFEHPTPQPIDSAPPPRPDTQAIAITPSQWTADTSENTPIQAWGIAGNWGHNTPREDHSFHSDDDNDIRFELRPGETYSGNWPDTPPTERCEMGMHDRPPTRDNTFVVSYDYMIEDGPPISSDWLTSGQFHSGLSASPPCEVMFHGNDCMGISANSGSSANERWGTAWQDDQPIQRGHWYKMHFNVELNPNGGVVMLWRDGELVCDYHGPVGYTDQVATYFKMGVYRKLPARGETVAAHFKNFKMVQGLQLPSPPEDSGGGGGGGGGGDRPDRPDRPVAPPWPEGLTIDQALAYTEAWVAAHK